MTLTERLQQLIANWGGAQRGQSLLTLHQECVDAVGRGNKLLPHLLPAQLLLVDDLDVTHLQRAFKRSNGIARNTSLQFRVPPSGRFDAALVPVGRADGPIDRFVLALEQKLALQDHVALYGHAVGHLLLNYQEEQLGQRRPFLAPQNGFAHADTLAELRLLETVKQEIDRRVLENFPLLTKLLEAPEESVAAFDAATVGLREQLDRVGWSGQFREMPYRFTDGRVFPGSSRRGPRLSVDALLRMAPSLPIALVHSVRAGEAHEDAARRLQSYARRMALPFAYLLEEDGRMQEFDWSGSQEPVVSTLAAFPGREVLWQRWAIALQLTEAKHRRALLHPYRRTSNKTPRYYQEAAINHAVIAVLQALDGLRSPRILLTLATGTGKTMVAFQILWKLKRERMVRNVLFLTDRDFLLSQAMDNEFEAFGDARHRIQGEISTAYDMNFATYQGITGPDRHRYLSYPANFFQVIVVDECHRGSAQETSAWREVLEHFSSAVQIGLTATPLSTDEVQTDEYFGVSIYKYSLRMGINDGFLAPYRVRRVLIGESSEDAPASLPAEQEMVEEPTVFNIVQDEDELTSIAIPASMETPGTMLKYTNAIAEHLAAFLQRTDSFAKTIVFCVDQAHAEQMRLALIEACASWAPHHAEYVVRIVSDEGPEGKRELGNFSTPDEKFPVVVTTSRLLSTGVDVPTCKNIVLARPVGSMVEFKQIIGRGTRLFEPQKRWFTILDYAGTIKHFFDPDFDGDPEIVEKEPLFPELPPPADSAPEQAAASASPSPVVYEEQSNYQLAASCPDAPSSSSACASTPFVPSDTAEPTQGAVQDIQDSANNAPVGQAGDSMSGTSGSTVDDEATSSNEEAAAGTPILPANPPADTHIVTKQMRDGRILKVVGEVIYELGPDGTTLRRGTYRECTVSTINSLVSTPADLRARWLKSEQRAEIVARLEDEGVDLQELAYQQRLMELDPLDLLLYVVFHEPVLTRAQRVERLRREHADFFQRYENTLLARAVLDVILDKYIKGEAPDVSDTCLLQVISLADSHTPVELARPFANAATNSTIRSVLKELQTLLYSV